MKPVANGWKVEAADSGGQMMIISNDDGYILIQQGDDLTEIFYRQQLNEFIAGLIAAGEGLDWTMEYSND